MNIKTTILFFTSLVSFYQIDISAGNWFSSLGAAAQEELNKGMTENTALADAQKKTLYKKATDTADAHKKMLRTKITETGVLQETLLSCQATSLATAQGDVLADRAKKEAKIVTGKILASAEIAKKKAATAGYNGVCNGAGKALDDAIETLKAKALVAAPYLIVGGVTIGVYLLYRYNYPPLSTVPQQAVMAENAYKNAEYTKKNALRTSREEFSQCLRYHVNGEVNTEGFPTACENSARTCALLAGPKAAQKRIETFKREANSPSLVPLYSVILLGIASSASSNR